MDIDRTQARRVVAAVVALLGLVCALDGGGLARLSAWSEIEPILPLWSVSASYVVTWLVARNLRGVRRRIALGAGSIATACLFDIWFAAFSLVWVIAFYRCSFAGGRARPGRGLAFALATLGGLAVACNRDLFGGWLDARPEIARVGYLFAVSHVLRIAWLLHQVRLERAVVPASDVALYFLFAPSFVIVPYMLAIPRFDRFRDSLDRSSLDVERGGVRLLAWGTALVLAGVALRVFYDPRVEFFASLRAHDVAGVAIHSVPYYPIHAALESCAIAAIVVGLCRVMGVPIGPSFHAPLLATSIGELWRRWNTHFRDLLVDLFYVPVALRLRRKPDRAIVMGCLAVFVVGSTLLHLPKHYFRYGSLVPSNLHILVENIAMCAIVAWSLVREARAIRARKPVRAVGPIVTALRCVRTWMLMLVAVVYAGYGTQYAVFGERPATAISRK